jgi:hypothetical protein
VEGDGRVILGDIRNLVQADLICSKMEELESTQKGMGMKF